MTSQPAVGSCDTLMTSLTHFITNSSFEVVGTFLFVLLLQVLKNRPDGTGSSSQPSLWCWLHLMESRTPVNHLWRQLELEERHDGERTREEQEPDCTPPLGLTPPDTSLETEEEADWTETTTEMEAVLQTWFYQSRVAADLDQDQLET